MFQKLLAFCRIFQNMYKNVHSKMTLLIFRKIRTGINRTKFIGTVFQVWRIGRFTKASFICQFLFFFFSLELDYTAVSSNVSSSNSRSLSISWLSSHWKPWLEEVVEMPAIKTKSCSTSPKWKWEWNKSSFCK